MALIKHTETVEYDSKGTVIKRVTTDEYDNAPVVAPVMPPTTYPYWVITYSFDNTKQPMTGSSLDYIMHV